jgi:two-component system, LytTR family, response regulator
MNQTCVKTFIVDDEVPSGLLLQKLLHDFPAFGEVSVINEPVKAFQEIVAIQPQFLFLDVEMPGTDGLQLHEMIRAQSPSTRVIYVTGHEKYALDALRLNPFDYLVKPVSREDLLRIHHKISTNKAEGESHQTIKSNSHNGHLLVKTHAGIHQILTDDIVYLEADCAYTHFILQNNKKITSSGHLGRLWQLLSPDKFIRISRKHLVNRKYLTFYCSKEKYLILEAPDTEYRLEIAIRANEIKKLLNSA